jgi:hypothetical protein
MPSKADKIFGPIEDQLGVKKPKIGYYESLDLSEGEERDPKNQAVVGGGAGYDPKDKKTFLYAEGKKGSFSAGVETKSKDEYSGNVGYDIDENTKVGITASKDDSGKKVSIGFNRNFNHGGTVEITKGKDYIKDLL